MKPRKMSREAFEALRQEAEQMVNRSQNNPAPDGETELMRLFQEIEARQAALELQNEDLRRTANHLAVSRNEFDMLYRALPVALITLNDKGLVNQFNPAAARMFSGFEKFSVGNTLTELIVKEDRGIYESQLQTAAAGGTGTHCELRLRDDMDRLIPVRLDIGAGLAADGRTLQWLLALVDVTDCKQPDEKLRNRELQYRNIFENHHAVMLLLDPATGHIIDANAAACTYYGYTRDEITTRNVADINTLSADTVSAQLRAARSRQERQFTFKHRLADGRIRDVEVLSGPVFIGGREVLFSIVHDITESKRAEEALRQSNQELHEYTYALTHNIKAPFRAIENYADFLTEDLAGTLDGEPKQYLEGIKKAAAQANNLFRDLETLYSIRNHAVNFESFEMRELLDEIHFMFKDTFAAKLTIAQEWPVFRCEKFLLRQILVDLIKNGFKYNRSKTKRVDIGWRQTPDDRIEIYVRDNGIGIESRYHGQVFEIFRRLHTDREHEGSGIGLAIARRAVQKMEGTLRVESKPGRGSTFWISLPGSILDGRDG